MKAKSIIHGLITFSPTFVACSFVGADGVRIPDVVRPPPGVVVVGREARIQDAERQLEGDEGLLR